MTNQDVFMFIDETGIDKESNIIALSCVATREPQHLRNKLKSLKKEMLKDKRLKDIPSIKNLEKKGFHYCEDHQDVRPLVIEQMAELPFEAYITYRPKENNFSPSSNFSWYDQLFGKMLYDRIQKYKQSSVSICFEQHGSSNSVREAELTQIIERLVREIRMNRGVTIEIFPTIKSAGKEESCLAIADYVAAVFKDYENTLKICEGIYEPGKSNSWQSRHFALLRPKIRVIHNLDTGEFFTRQKMFP